jgi:hypothetical protein
VVLGYYLKAAEPQTGVDNLSPFLQERVHAKPRKPRSHDENDWWNESLCTGGGQIIV